MYYILYVYIDDNIIYKYVCFKQWINNRGWTNNLCFNSQFKIDLKYGFQVFKRLPFKTELSFSGGFLYFFCFTKMELK